MTEESESFLKSKTVQDGIGSNQNYQSVDSAEQGTIARTETKPPHKSVPPLDRDAVHFGVRMSVCITVACLFILLRPPGESLHQAVWIVVTVQFVCWFPSLDAASVVEKSIQRLYGTFVGASTGLTCGFLSLAILRFGRTGGYNVAAQSLFLICCIATYTYTICWGSVQYKIQGTKIIAKYNYACILSLLTFYICLLPFYSDEKPKWSKAVFRVFNVVVGCILGAGLSISILPRSTAKIVHLKMERQIRLAGEAAQAVLHMAADSFSESAYVTRKPVSEALADTLPSSKGMLAFDFKSIREIISLSRRHWHKDNEPLDSEDLALNKYESALQDSRSIKTQLSNLRYDPFNLGTPDLLLTTFKSEMNNTLARALRIQNTVILLDGIVRNDPKHDFSEFHINLFADTGSLIHQMLSCKGESSEAAFAELTEKLAQIRQSIIELAGVVASSGKEVPPEALGVGMWQSNLDLAGLVVPERPRMDHVVRDASMESLMSQDNDHDGRGLPKYVHGSRVCALLFLQLVEHLALRSVRLYQSWKDCQGICDACEKKFA